MDEIWRDIKGYEGLYQVSNLGNVRRVLIHGFKAMKPTDNGHGYMIVGLSINRCKKNYYIHRLVAEAFLIKTIGKNYVNHIDFNTSNNEASNLEWCTQKENVYYSKHHMKKQHSSQTKTGERHITYREENKRFRVCIKKADADKQFSSIEDAIVFRNEVLNEINYSI